MVHTGVVLPGVFPRHPVGEGGEDVEGVPAGGEGYHQDDVGDGGGDGPRHQPGDRPGHVVQEDGAEHAGEEEGGVVVVDVEDSAHGPEGNVVERPTQEQPGSRNQGRLSLLQHGGALRHAALGLEVGVGVDHQEYQQEDDVAPPDDGVAQQIHASLVIASYDSRI